MTLALMLAAVHLSAHAERTPPWTAEATGTKAGYEPVFQHYRKMEGMPPVDQEGGSHQGHTGHEGHDMATPHRGHGTESAPAEGKPDPATATTNHDAQHQHHH